MKLSVPDMSCGHCKASITEAIHALDGSAALKFDMEHRTVEVSSALPQDGIIAALDDIGFEATPQAA